MIFHAQRYFPQKEQVQGAAAGVLREGKDLLSRVTHPNLMSDKDRFPETKRFDPVGLARRGQVLFSGPYSLLTVSKA